MTTTAAHSYLNFAQKFARLVFDSIERRPDVGLARHQPSNDSTFDDLVHVTLVVEHLAADSAADKRVIFAPAVCFERDKLRFSRSDVARHGDRAIHARLGSRRDGLRITDRRVRRVPNRI